MLILKNTLKKIPPLPALCFLPDPLVWPRRRHPVQNEASKSTAGSFLDPPCSVLEHSVTRTATSNQEVAAVLSTEHRMEGLHWGQGRNRTETKWEMAFPQRVQLGAGQVVRGGNGLAVA